MKTPTPAPATGTNAAAERPIEDLILGNAFRASMIPRADSYNGPAPLWHGWVIMDAYLAGLDEGRSRPAHLAAIAAAREAIKELMALVDDFLPNIGRCALQNYRRLNEAPIKGQAALDKLEAVK